MRNQLLIAALFALLGITPLATAAPGRDANGSGHIQEIDGQTIQLHGKRYDAHGATVKAVTHTDNGDWKVRTLGTVSAQKPIRKLLPIGTDRVFYKHGQDNPRRILKLWTGDVPQ